MTRAPFVIGGGTVGACGPLHPRDSFYWGAPGGTNPPRIPHPTYRTSGMPPCGSGAVRNLTARLFQLS